MSRPDIAQLTLRACRACGFPVPAAVLAELLLDPGSEKLGIFVGAVAEEPCALVVAQLPISAFTLAPMVLLAYSERAPAALVRIIGQRLAGWIRDNGFDRALALNLRHSDRSFCRGLAHFGVPSRAGGVIAFAMTPASGEAT